MDAQSAGGKKKESAAGENLKLLSVAGGEGVTGAMRLESLTKNRENLVGHYEDLRLCPEEHSSYRSILKQSKTERLSNLRRQY